MRLSARTKLASSLSPHRLIFLSLQPIHQLLIFTLEVSQPQSSGSDVALVVEEKALLALALRKVSEPVGVREQGRVNFRLLSIRDGIEALESSAPRSAMRTAGRIDGLDRGLTSRSGRVRGATSAEA